MFVDFARARSIKTGEDLAEYYHLTPRQKRMINNKLALGESFPEAWATVFAADKFGEATTHWRKLKGLVQRGLCGP